MTETPDDLISQATDWRDISTAPKDGRVVYACNNKMAQESLVYFNEQGEWECVSGLSNFPIAVGFYPTHWKPRDPLPPYCMPSKEHSNPKVTV